MSRNGSGTYNPPTNSWNPAVNGVSATAVDWQSILNDLSAALTQSVSRDGQAAMTGNLPMAGNKLTGLGAGVATGDSVRWEQLFDQGVEQDVASAATTDIGIINSNFIRVTGTTTITSFGINYKGPRFVRFAGVLTLTHNGTTLVLPTSANITTAAGDRAIITPIGNPASGWQVLAYQRADGSALTASNDLLNTTRIDVASASTVNLTSSAPNTRNINITGTTTITAFTVAVGQTYFVRFDNSLTLTNNANIVTQTGANIETRAGDTCIIRATAANTVEVLAYTTASPRYQIQPINATVAANALTITINPTELDFRSATLGSGAVNRRKITSAISLVISSGSTLGTISGQASRIAVLAIDNSGTVEVAAVNLAGGTNLDETGVISTTAEGGAGAADSATVIYSTTARTNVPYRVVGYVESTQATAGIWATAPSTIQGVGGQALTSLQSIGFGQTYQSVTRTSGVTYYNTTGKPLHLVMNINSTATASASVSIAINGGTAFTFLNVAAGTGPGSGAGSVMIAVGSSYVVTETRVAARAVVELR